MIPSDHATVSSSLRTEAEEFLYREALLIDERRYQEWLALFTSDALYWVPAEEDEIDPRRQVSIIYDESPQRALRVQRLEHRNNWREDPPGRLRHFVTNVLVDHPGGDELLIRSNQLICHSRRDQTVMLPAHCVHRVRMADDGWLIALKKVLLLESDRYLMPDAIVLL